MKKKHLLYILPQVVIWTPFLLYCDQAPFMTWWSASAVLSVCAGVWWDKKYGPGATNA